MGKIKGVGLGLRHNHFQEFIENKPDVSWLEVHTENFFSEFSTSSKYVATIRQDYPISAHCVGLSLGSAAVSCPVREKHLQQIKKTINWLQPSMVSDHLSWSASDGVHYLPDLLPIPYTEEAFDVVTKNINRVQDVLQRQILIENPSSYLSFNDSTMLEWEFLAELSNTTGCGLLLDVNNIFVSAFNHNFNALTYLESLPIEAVKEIHLAGYSIEIIEGKEVYIDTHGQKVYDGVWQLFEKTIQRFGDVPTLIEWDTDVPELSVLLAEKEKAEAIIAKVLNNQVT
jgi:uncharacterized protein (UPF0276 family)